MTADNFRLDDATWKGSPPAGGGGDKVFFPEAVEIVGRTLFPDTWRGALTAIYWDQLAAGEWRRARRILAAHRPEMSAEFSVYSSDDEISDEHWDAAKALVDELNAGTLSDRRRLRKVLDGLLSEFGAGRIKTYSRSREGGELPSAIGRDAWVLDNADHIFERCLINPYNSQQRWSPSSHARSYDNHKLRWVFVSRQDVERYASTLARQEAGDQELLVASEIIRLAAMKREPIPDAESFVAEAWGKSAMPPNEKRTAALVALIAAAEPAAPSGKQKRSSPAQDAISRAMGVLHPTGFPKGVHQQVVLAQVQEHCRRNGISVPSEKSFQRWLKDEN